MKQTMKTRLAEFSFVLPALILFVLFVVVPFVQGFPMSFTDWDGMSRTSNPIGLDNYIRAFSDKNLIRSIQNTVFFTVMTVVFPNLIGLGIALLIQRSSRWNNFVRTIVFMPYCLSIVLTAFTWKYLFNDVFYGVFGILSPLGSAEYVMWGLSIMCIWATSGYCMVIYIAGLQGVPPIYYEAARIDGASAVQTFFYITLPSIMPAITLNITLPLAWGLKAFDYPMAATQGGPGRASETVALIIYNNLFKYFKAGYGQAIAILLTIAIFIISASVSSFFRAREEV